MKWDYSNRVAVITGGSSGIGRATAIAFAECGAKVTIGDIDEAGSLETVQMIKENGGDAIFFQTDVSNPIQVQALINTTVATYGRLDFGVNNAGIGGNQAPTADLSFEDWTQVIGINLTGAWLCMKYEIPVMLKNGGGVIVNMDSILGQVGFPNASAYVASKHGLLGLTKSAALEYATLGIRINAVCPAFIETPMIEQGGIVPGTPFYELLTNAHPIHRLGRPEEIANVVTWLCSPDASFITGAPILVDGGYVAQ